MCDHGITAQLAFRLDTVRLCVCQAAEQERSRRERASEAELRRSIEASLVERVKQEKLSLSRKALEMGKQKVLCLLPNRIVKSLLWLSPSHPPPRRHPPFCGPLIPVT